MPREFSRNNWPQEDGEETKEVNAWTGFFLFVWAALFLTVSFWLVFWVLKSEEVINWLIPWWKCGILAYCFLVITGITRIYKKTQ